MGWVEKTRGGGVPSKYVDGVLDLIGFHCQMYDLHVYRLARHWLIHANTAFQMVSG